MSIGSESSLSPTATAKRCKYCGELRHLLGCPVENSSSKEKHVVDDAKHQFSEGKKAALDGQRINTGKSSAWLCGWTVGLFRRHMA